MKKKIISIFALIAMVLVMPFAFMGCGTDADKLQEENESLKEQIAQTTAFYELVEEETLTVTVKNGKSFVCVNPSSMSMLYFDSNVNCTIDIDRWYSDYFGDYETVSVGAGETNTYTTPGDGLYKFTVTFADANDATLSLTLTRTARQ